MLSRQHRVTRRRFPFVLKASRSYHSPPVSLRVALRPGDDLRPTLFAFIVSRKVAAKAVDRNKLKRRARAIVREFLPKIKDNYACLLFFKKEAAALTYQELKKVIYDLLSLSSIIF
ncbi:MAG: ribonuclease P protein component [Candidatus Vogelbacteria bacterium]